MLKVFRCMARYLGPKHRMCRKVGVKLCPYKKCPAQRRAYRPGQHGPSGPLRLTNYGQQLLEKQKAKWFYGILEKQFRTYYVKSLKSQKETGVALQEILESRLDNAIFRLGFASSRAQARQWINHGHFQVNGKKVDIPSYQIRVGDIVTLAPRAHKKKIQEYITENSKTAQQLSWLALDAKNYTGKIMSKPGVTEGEQSLNMQMIVEYYSR